MHCPHCRAVNHQAEERCVHCGRRLNGEAQGPYPIRAAATAAATAPALQPFPDRESPPGKTPAPAKPQETPNYQPSLFSNGSRDGSAGKVIPIPTLTPLHPSSTDPELASYLVGYVETAALEGVLERLRRCDGVEGAYAKPRGEPPERM